MRPDGSLRTASPTWHGDAGQRTVDGPERGVWRDGNADAGGGAGGFARPMADHFSGAGLVTGGTGARVLVGADGVSTTVGWGAAAGSSIIGMALGAAGWPFATLKTMVKTRPITTSKSTAPPSSVAIIPQTRPAFVLPRPLGSMVPVSISLRSLRPMTQAAMPSGRQQTMPRMPNNSTKVPRWGFIPDDALSGMAALQDRKAQGQGTRAAAGGRSWAIRGGGRGRPCSGQ
jgi:hypothetical protein